LSRPVLVIDDNWDVRILTARLLRYLGEDAVCVSGGAEALAYLRDQRPKMVLLDLMMPEMDGMQVLDAIRGRPELAGLAVVMFSAANEEELRAAVRRGADDYLLKGTAGLDDIRDRVNRFGREAAAHENRWAAS
jgi:CheY-like chemotaxis protein